MRYRPSPIRFPSVFTFAVVRAEGLEPPRPKPPEPKSGVSTNSTTPAHDLWPKGSSHTANVLPKGDCTLPKAFFRHSLRRPKRPSLRMIESQRETATGKTVRRSYICAIARRSTANIVFQPGKQQKRPNFVQQARKIDQERQSPTAKLALQHQSVNGRNVF